MHNDALSTSSNSEGKLDPTTISKIQILLQNDESSIDHIYKLEIHGAEADCSSSIPKGNECEEDADPKTAGLDVNSLNFTHLGSAILNTSNINNHTENGDDDGGSESDSEGPPIANTKMISISFKDVAVSFIKICICHPNDTDATNGSPPLTVPSGITQIGISSICFFGKAELLNGNLDGSEQEDDDWSGRLEALDALKREKAMNEVSTQVDRSFVVSSL